MVLNVLTFQSEVVDQRGPGTADEWLECFGDVAPVCVVEDEFGLRSVEVCRRFNNRDGEWMLTSLAMDAGVAIASGEPVPPGGNVWSEYRRLIEDERSCGRLEYGMAG